MTGLEKLAFLLTASAVASASQITIDSTGTVFGIAWALLGAAVATGMNYGITKQRLNNLEKQQEKLATKESVDALHGKFDTLVKILGHRADD